MNELEIKTAIRRNDWEALAKIADSLCFFHHYTFDGVLDLFERCGADREMLAREFFA